MIDFKCHLCKESLHAFKAWEVVDRELMRYECINKKCIFFNSIRYRCNVDIITPTDYLNPEPMVRDYIFLFENKNRWYRLSSFSNKTYLYLFHDIHNINSLWAEELLELDKLYPINPSNKNLEEQILNIFQKLKILLMLI